MSIHTDRISTGFIRFLIPAVLLLILLPACSPRTSGEQLPEGTEITELKAHTWYAFTPSGFEPVDSPRNVAETLTKPWTEAVRIAAAGTSGQTACALVNRLGIIDFSSGSPVLYRDIQLFTGVTADTLLFTPEGPVFHLYRNTFFNDNSTRQTEQTRPLLVRYNSRQQLCIPILTYQDLGIPDTGEITSIIPSNGAWLAAIKTTGSDKTDFSYIRFSSLTADGAIPDPVSALLTLEETDADTFRQAQRPLPFEQAPESLQLLFREIPVSVSFYLSCRLPGYAGSVLYDNADSVAGGYTAQGCAVISETGSVAVFSDGTTYLTRSLLSGNTFEDTVIALRLPRLPAGFVYGETAVYGSTLYVAWEETDFYKTGRSGFIAVNLTEIGRQLEQQ